MKVDLVDLSQIVAEITASFETQATDRKVAFAIQDNVNACGDEHLIRIVLQNLLDNAWKFTTKKEQADIEFGCIHDQGITEYYVRDNGAGFDMNYAHKLFGAFQRLHAMGEFRGTGIGLATVQRIIHRHGGSIRAEATVNQGATFYFTLNTRDCE
jgi:light-regulated signal transduction histidine kinase (bacteriophytochrome)